MPASTTDAVAAPPSTAAHGGREPLLRPRKLTFHALTVTAIRRLTSDSVEVVFAVPDELAGDYDYLPGQHVAVRLTLGGREIRRSYSLCAPPGGGELHFAVKIEPGGVFSTFATSELAVGDTVEVMTPQGSFTVRPSPDSAAHVAAIAAGSGITPIMALAEAVLTQAPGATFTLVYSSRTAETVMFVEELADLKDRFLDRFEVHHVLTREQRPSPVHTGRLSPERLDVVFDRIVPPERVDEWFLCGPIDLVTEVRAELAARGTPLARVHVELFSTGAPPRTVLPASRVAAASDGLPAAGTRDGNAPRAAAGHAAAEGVIPGIPHLKAGEALVTMHLNGQSARVVCGADERILDAALRVRSDTPFSCTNGVCGTCRARLTTGTVEMETNYALEDDELDAGYILTCQSVCTSANVEVDYDA